MTNETTALLAVSLFRTKGICHFFILFLSFGMASTTKQAETKRSRNSLYTDKVSKDDYDAFRNKFGSYDVEIKCEATTVSAAYRRLLGQ